MTEITMDAPSSRHPNKSEIIKEWAQRLQMAVVGCAVYYEGITEVPSVSDGSPAFFTLLRKKLRGSLATCVAVHADAYEDWEEDENNVGFMVKVDGASFLRSPVHLVPLVPDGHFSSLVWKLTNEVRLSKNSVMALSGSNAVRRVFQYVDDVDFFEYVPDEPEHVREKLGQRIFATGPMVCASAKLGKDAFVSPFDRAQIDEAVRTLSEGDTDLLSVKLDFLTLAMEDRPFEVTNISAFVGVDFSGGAKRRTFPFQEFLLSQREVVPSQLDDPIQVGEYVCWLMAEIKKYRLQNNSLKSAKRALNLARFCWFDDIVNDLHFLFENTTVVHEAEIQATRHALLRVNNGEITFDGWDEAEIKDRLTLLLAEKRAKKLKEKKHFPAGFDESVDRIVSTILRRISHLSGGTISDV